MPRGGGSRGGQEPKGIGRAEHAGAHGGGTVPGTHTRTVAEDRQDESPQPLPALLSSFGIAASILTTAELVVSILLQPTHPPSESDQRRDEATWLLHQSQQGRRGRRHHLVIYIKVNRARENAGIIYIHQSHRSRRGRHVYMISKSTRSSTRPAGGATMRSFELGGMPACSSTDSCRSTDNFRSTDTRSSASSSVPVGLCALFPAHRGQP